MREYTTNDLAEYTNQVIQSIAQGCSIEELIQFTYQTFQLAVIVADPGYRLITYAGDREPVDPYWRQIIASGEPTDHTIMEYYINDGLMKAITSSKEAIYIDWGVCVDFPQTSGPIYIDQNLEGFVSILFMNEEILDFSLQLNNLLRQFCTILMRSKNFRLKHAMNPVKELLAQKFFDTQHYPHAASLEEYLSTVNILPNYCIAVLSEKNKDDVILSHIKSRVVKGRSDILYLVKEQKLYLLFHQLKAIELSDYFSSLIQQYGVYCGTSTIFSSLNDRKYCIQQAELAHATAQALDNNGCLNYTEALSSILLMQPISEIQPENLAPKSLQTLLAYDDLHETTFVKTLEAYLEQRNDINKTANALHIHRNTLIYRLNKIRDLMEVAIDNPETAWLLQLALRVQRLVKSSSGKS